MDQLENECQRLLSELNELEHQDALCSALQRRYNQIIDDQWSPSLPDPLTALPPEICTQIFEEAIGPFDRAGPRMEHLLLLSGVSATWCQFLASVSSFWAVILLSQEREDDLAKAVTCLTLSRESKITLYVMPFCHAKEAYYAALAPHVGRIAEIHWWNVKEDFFHFVQSLEHLPALNRVESLHGHDSCTEKEFSQLMQSAPSLVSLVPLELTADMLRHTRAIKLTYIRTRLSLSGLLHILCSNSGTSQLRPSVSDLNLLSPLTDVSVEKIPRVSLDLDKLSLSEPSSGYNNLFKHHFKNIQFLAISITSEELFGELFIALQHSPKVIGLDVTIMDGIQTIPTRSDYHMLRSLTHLTISKGDGDRIIDLNRMLKRVPTIMPCLQDISVFGRVVSPAKGMDHLSPLKNLWQVRIYNIDSPITLNTDLVYLDHLESLELSTASLQDYDYMQLKNLRYLSTSLRRFIFDKIDFSQVIPVTCAIPSSSFSTVVRLGIFFAIPIRLELQFLSSLQHLILGDELSETWAGDILEQLIVSPKFCPKLSILAIWGSFTEWDLLLLMLLRRNFLHDRSISMIQELETSVWLSIKLLVPISQLLRGHFVPELDLNDFSLERIAQILYRVPSESRRCRHCCYMLHEDCQDALCSVHEPYAWMEAIEGGWEYQLASTQPDPPLPAYMSQWLAGKWARRRAFVAAFREAERRRQAIGNCDYEHPYPAPRITGFTMDGRIWDGR